MNISVFPKYIFWSWKENTEKMLIEISLSIGKAPIIEFKPLDTEISQPNENTSSEDPLHDLNQVAEPFNNLKANI